MVPHKASFSRRGKGQLGRWPIEEARSNLPLYSFVIRMIKAYNVLDLTLPNGQNTYAIQRVRAF